MQMLETYKGFRLRAQSVPVLGRWGFEYNVDHFPKFGRGFRARFKSPAFANEDDAVHAAMDNAKLEIETFAEIARIEAAVE
jgi:hypothetical protein